MALNFPSSPTLNQTYTFNGRTWKWNGTGWALQTQSQIATSAAVSMYLYATCI